MKIVKAIQALALGLVLISAAACQNRPVHNVDNHPIPAVAQKLSLKEIEQGIIQAGSARRWRFERLGDGQLRAKQSDEKDHEAVVDITFTQTAYSIRLSGSSRLKEKDGTIHPRYNIWARNLEKDIEDRLYAMGMARQ
jgi:hypothetical protein